jgi:hypothetical protein
MTEDHVSREYRARDINVSRQVIEEIEYIIHKLYVYFAPGSRPGIRATLTTMTEGFSVWFF